MWCARKILWQYCLCGSYTMHFTHALCIIYYNEDSTSLWFKCPYSRAWLFCFVYEKCAKLTTSLAAITLIILCMRHQQMRVSEQQVLKWTRVFFLFVDPNYVSLACVIFRTHNKYQGASKEHFITPHPLNAASILVNCCSPYEADYPRASKNELSITCVL